MVHLAGTRHIRAVQAPCKEGFVPGAQQAAGISWSRGEGHVSGGQRQTEVVGDGGEFSAKED